MCYYQFTVLNYLTAVMLMQDQRLIPEILKSHFVKNSSYCVLALYMCTCFFKSAGLTAIESSSCMTVSIIIIMMRSSSNYWLQCSQ